MARVAADLDASDRDVGRQPGAMCGRDEDIRVAVADVDRSMDLGDVKPPRRHQREVVVDPAPDARPAAPPRGSSPGRSSAGLAGRAGRDRNRSRPPRQLTGPMPIKRCTSSVVTDAAAGPTRSRSPALTAEPDIGPTFATRSIIRPGRDPSIRTRTASLGATVRTAVDPAGPRSDTRVVRAGSVCATPHSARRLAAGLRGRVPITPRCG